MSEEKKKKNSIVSKIPLSILSCCVIIVVLAFTLFKQLEINESLRSEMIENERNVLTQVDKALSLSKEDNMMLQKKIKLLHKQLEAYQQPDELLVHDIEDYIRSKYYRVPKSLAADIAENIVKHSKEANISPELVLGIIEVESSFNPMAVSSKKARGLMQLMPEWAKKLEVDNATDFHDIDTNIRCGIQVLKIHIEDDGKGNITKGLYYYVGKSDSYADKVYVAIGKFVSFRYKHNSDEEKAVDSKTTEGEKIATVKGTTDDS